MFIYERQIHFYETDMMGIVHHGNYLRLVEECRVDWALKRKLIQSPEEAARFAVLGSEVRYLQALKFADQIEIHMQSRIKGVRIFFEYKIFKKGKTDAADICAEARTEHCSMEYSVEKGRHFANRPVDSIRKAMEGEKWNETWLLSL